MHPANNLAISSILGGVIYIYSAHTDAQDLGNCNINDQAIYEIIERGCGGIYDLFDKWIKDPIKALLNPKDIDVSVPKYSITISTNLKSKKIVQVDDKCTHLKIKADVGVIGLIVGVSIFFLRWKRYID